MFKINLVVLKRAFALFLMSYFNYKLVNGTHFRGGIISAYPISYNADTVTMQLNTRFAWRKTYDATTQCDLNTIASQKLIGPTGSYLTCKKNCYYKSEIVGTSRIVCTSFSIIDDWSYGENSYTFNFNITDDYEFSFSGSSWALLAQYGYNSTSLQGWEIRCTLNTVNRTDINKVNSSPRTIMPPVVTIRSGQTYDIKIPTTDADNDIVRCRWARWDLKECGDVCKAISFAELNEDNCVLTVNTTNATLGLYAIAIQVEDFQNPNGTVPFSSVPLQFVVSVVQSPSNCTTEPTLGGDLPLDACIVVDTMLDVHVKAKVICANQTLTDIQIVGPLGTQVSNLAKDPTQPSTWYKNLTWTPSNPGKYSICSKATDTSLLASVSSCFQILVGVPNPKVNESTLEPNDQTLITNSVSSVQTFNCSFMVNVEKPNITAHIRVMSETTDQEIYSIDSSLPNTTIFEPPNKMSFQLPIGTFPDGVYYILFDYGVAKMHDYCQPLSQPIKNRYHWTFLKFSGISCNNIIDCNITVYYNDSNLNPASQEFNCDASSLFLLTFLFSLLNLLAHFSIKSFLFKKFKPKIFPTAKPDPNKVL